MFCKGDRVQTLVYTMYPGLGLNGSGLNTKRIKCGTVTKDNLTDMIGGPEVKVLWDGDDEPESENPYELDKEGA